MGKRNDQHGLAKGVRANASQPTANQAERPTEAPEWMHCVDYWRT